MMKEEVFVVPTTNLVFTANEQLSSAQSQIGPRSIEPIIEESSFDRWSELFDELQAEGWSVSQFRNISLASSEAVCEVWL